MTDEARKAILGRIKQALSRRSPKPHWVDQPISDRPLLHGPADDDDARRDRFRTEFETLRGEWHEFEDESGARQWFDDWTKDNAFEPTFAVEHPLLRKLLGDRPNLDWVSAEGGLPNWDRYKLGITPCVHLVAESGSILVSSALSGRAPSVLPPTHLVIATRDQIVADLAASFARLRERTGDLPSNLSWITGPSRTADIEKILVLGIHGPRRLVVMMLPR